MTDESKKQTATFADVQQLISELQARYEGARSFSADVREAAADGDTLSCLSCIACRPEE